MLRDLDLTRRYRAVVFGVDGLAMRGRVRYQRMISALHYVAGGCG
jgi:hypothetical protein